MISKVFQITVIVFALLFVTVTSDVVLVSDVFAGNPGAPPQPATPPPLQPLPVAPSEKYTAEGGPSSGLMVAAALELAGYRSQAQVLRDLKVLIGRLGALIYVCCVIGFIVTIALGGHYIGAVWFLLGPALFFSLLNTTVESRGPKWLMGNYPVVQELRDKVPLTLLGGSAEPVKVLWAFERINSLTSEFTQNLIKILTSGDTKKQLEFMGRAKITDRLFAGRIADDGLQGFIGYTFSECREAMDAARTLAKAAIDPSYANGSDFRTARANYCAQLNGKRVVVGGMPANVRDYVKKSIMAFQNRGAVPSGWGTWAEIEQRLLGRGPGTGERKINDLDACVGAIPEGVTEANFMDRFAATELTCQKLWCMMGIGVRKEVMAYLEPGAQGGKIAPHPFLQTSNKNLADTQMSKKELEAMLKDIVAKFTKQDRVYGTKDAGSGTPTNLPKGVICPGTNTPISQDTLDLAIIPAVIGGHWIRKLMQRDPRAIMMSSVTSHAGVYQGPAHFTANMSREQREEMLRRYAQHEMSEARRYEIFTFAMALPYIQGLVLYVLAVLFPFFLLMLIIPGKAGAFLIWIALWMWVKMWDVGFTIIMMADKVLWDLLPHSSVMNPLSDPNNGPASLFESAFQGDPSYSLANYYVMLGVMMSAVPMITAQIVLGSKKAVAGVLLGGIQSLSQTYGGAIGDWVATADHEATIERIREDKLFQDTTRNLGQSGSSLMDREKAEIDKSFARASKHLANADAAATSAGITNGTSSGLIAGAATALVVCALIPVIGWFGALVIVGVAAVGTALRTGQNTYEDVMRNQQQSATRLQRMGNAMRINWTKANAQVRYQNAALGDDVRNLEALRAGVTNRAEWWATPDAPIRALAALASKNVKTELQSEQNSGRLGGNITRADYNGWAVR